MQELYKFLGRVVTEIVNPLILLLSASAFIVFLWGVFEFIANAGDAEKRSQGRRAMFWGIIGLVIIFGVYGIVDVALQTVFPGSPSIKQLTAPK